MKHTALEKLKLAAAAKGVPVKVIEPTFEERVAAAAAKAGTTGKVVPSERGGVIVFLASKSKRDQ